MTDRQIIIPTAPGMGRGLINHDDRSKAYRAVDLLESTQAPRTKTWRRGAAYDQARTSECVPNTGKGMVNTALLSANRPYPVRSKYDRHTWYIEARKRDQWPGEDYDGTSALGLCRYLLEVGIISEYRWCFGLDDVLRTLSWVGPVGLGIKWTEAMFTPDANGFIVPEGAEAGGHEIEATAIDARQKTVTLTNSWSSSWGINGRAKLTWDNLGKLLDDQGDAFVILK